MLKESKFYCIQPLISQIENKLLINKNNINEPYYVTTKRERERVRLVLSNLFWFKKGSAIVAMVTSKNELQRILSSTEKVFFF